MTRRCRVDGQTTSFVTADRRQPSRQRCCWRSRVSRDFRSPARAARMARLRRRPRQLAVRRRDADHQVQRQPASGGLDVPARPDRLQPGRRARRRLRPRPERLVRGARRGDRQAALDPRGRAGLQQPRRQLLGEQGRQGPPADLQLEQLPPGDRRADRRDHFLVRHGRPRGSARRVWTGIRRRSTSRPAHRDGSSRT